MATHFSIWRRVLVGENTYGDGMRSALEKKRIKVGVVADYTLGQFDYKFMLKELDLALVSVSDLGFSEPTSYKEIFAKAYTMGLRLCPPEVGAELCIQYDDLPPKSPALHIAMQPIKGQFRYWHIFSLVINQLQTARADPVCCDTFNPEDQFIFVIPRP